MGMFQNARINVSNWIAPKGNDLTEESSGVQVRSDGRAGKAPSGSQYEFYRRIRHYPTIALARVATVAPIIAAKWTVQADDDAPSGAKELIEETMIPVRPMLLEHALFYGYVDYGWAGFEKVWENRNGLFTIKKFKPLLHDITQIVVDPETGSFIGYEQKGKSGKAEVRLPKSLHYSFRMEGQNWYGESLYENVIKVVNAYDKTELSSQKYDEKIAASIRVLHYKAGRATVNGTETEGSKAANAILDNLRSGGDVAIPHSEQDIVNGNSPWKLEYISSGGAAQYGFAARAGYLDKLMVRGMLQPERAILEGEHGTKADAEAHGSTPITMAELTHEKVTQATNWHAVNPILVANWGDAAANKVRLVATEIVDEKKKSLETLMAAMITNPATFVNVFSQLDIEAIIDQLDYPKLDGAIVPTLEPISLNDQGRFANNLDLFSERLRRVVTA